MATTKTKAPTASSTTAAKSTPWTKKMQQARKQKVVVLDKAFAGIPAGSKMLVATPALVARYIEKIPKGETRNIVRMRNELARHHRAQASCPVSTAIFLRIVAEAALEDLASGKSLAEVTPFWRVVDEDSPLAKKLDCDAAFFRTVKHWETA